MNYLAILIAAIAGTVIGALWYGPVFGKLWIRLSGFTKKDMEKAKKQGMGKSYTLAFLGTLIMAGVLECLLAEVGATTPLRGATWGFYAWLGFIVTTLLNSVLWEGRPWKIYWLNIGHYLVVLLAMGLILGAW